MKTLVLFLFCGFAVGSSQEQKTLDSLEVSFQNHLIESISYRINGDTRKAISALKICTEIHPKKAIIYNEFGKNYAIKSEFSKAASNFGKAIELAPKNMWFVYDFWRFFKNQKSISISTLKRLAERNSQFKLHLAILYGYQENYQQSLNTLKASKNIPIKIIDSLVIIYSKPKKSKPKKLKLEKKKTENPIDIINTTVKNYIKKEQSKPLLDYVKTSLESYPTLPILYYGYGWALNKEKKYKKAIQELKTGLDFTFDNPSLENKIYKILSSTYKNMGNNEKSNFYLQKTKHD